VGDLIPLSSGDPEKDEILGEINKNKQEAYKIKAEAKTLIFAFALLGIFSVASFLAYIVYDLWETVPTGQKIVLGFGMICTIVIAIRISVIAYRFIFKYLK